MTRQHQVDVGIRARILTAAQARLDQVREQERATKGVPSTTLSDVGRAILFDWKATDPPAEEVAVTEPGDRGHIGHRVFPVAKTPKLRKRRDRSDADRVVEIVRVLAEIAANPSTIALSQLAEVDRAIRAEKLADYTFPDPPNGETTVGRLAKRTRRALLPPFRFTMPHAVYEDIYQELRRHQTTVTRVLEDGLTRFAKTGTHKVTEEPVTQ